MKKAPTHPLLKTPIIFDRERTQAVYDFSLLLKGLQHEGLSEHAKPYEPHLRSSVIAAHTTDIADIVELEIYIARVNETIDRCLRTVVPGQKYNANAGTVERAKIGVSFDRIMDLMRKTMAVALQLKSVKTELQKLRKKTDIKNPSQMRAWLASPQAPVLSSISEVRRNMTARIKNVMAIAHTLGLDIGDDARRVFELDEEIVVPSTGIEPVFPASEASGLSVNLRGR
jgi:hypothetical protein